MKIESYWGIWYTISLIPANFYYFSIHTNDHVNCSISNGENDKLILCCLCYHYKCTLREKKRVKELVHAKHLCWVVPLNYLSFPELQECSSLQKSSWTLKDRSKAKHSHNIYLSTLWYYFLSKIFLCSLGQTKHCHRIPVCLVLSFLVYFIYHSWQARTPKILYQLSKSEDRLKKWTVTWR